MTEETSAPGMTTIAAEVLLSIARLTTLNVAGVNQMSSVPRGMERLWRRDHIGEGVRVEVVDNTVNADLYLTLNKDVNIRQVSRNIQKDVARAISEMVGMEVGRINIHIEDIAYEVEE